MATANSGSLKQAQHKAARQVRRAATAGWVENVERLGYVARGLLYIIMGGLALQLVTGSGGKTSDPVGALKFIAGQPYGKTLLVVMIIGLAGYSFWGFMRGLFDALGKGSDAKGLIQRVGYLISAISYGVLILPAYQLLSGTGSASGQQAGNPQGITAQLMSKPYGLFLVYLFGAFWVVAGLGQLYTAISASFMHDLSARRMTADERRWAEITGRIGYAARAVVYGTLGYFVFQAATTANPKQAQGIDGVMVKLLSQPNGHLLLGLVAAGLVVFGFYSVLSARWYRLQPVERG
jgi:hypothetical protein